MKRITVVGTDFGGLTAVSTLRKLEPVADITVIGRQPEFFYYPSLIWIPSGMRSGDDITINLKNFFRHKQVVSATVAGWSRPITARSRMMV